MWLSFFFVTALVNCETIPSSIGSDYAGLWELEAGSSGYTGSIPTEIGIAYQNMQKLDLSHNSLTGFVYVYRCIRISF